MYDLHNIIKIIPCSSQDWFILGRNIHSQFIVAKINVVN